MAKMNLGFLGEADSLLMTALRVRNERLGADHPWTKETAAYIEELLSM